MTKFAKLFERYKTYDDSEGRGTLKEWRDSFESTMGVDEANRIIHKDDPLLILGLSDLPSLNELKKVYRQLMKTNHPDKGGDPILCKKIIAAYTVLEKKIS